MTFYLEPQESTGLPPLDAHIPTRTESFTGGYWLDRLERNTWNVNQRYQDEVENEVWARLGREPEFEPPSLDDPKLAGRPNAVRRRGSLWEEVRRQAAQDPTSWAGVPLSEEQFEAEWTRRLRSSYADATVLLDNRPDGRWGLETAGRLASGVVDPITLATAPFGAPARVGIAGAMAIEGSVNALGSVMNLPSQMEQAERLEIAPPDAATQVATDFVLGAGIGGVVAGGARFLRYRQDRTAASAARRADGSALAWEGQVQAEADRLAADRERAAGGGHRPRNAVQAEFNDALRGYGVPPHVIGGVNLNVVDESGWNPTIIGDGGAAQGLMQWNGPRKALFERLGLDWSKPADQATMYAFESGILPPSHPLYGRPGFGSHADAYAAAVAAPDDRRAAVAVLEGYEKPAARHMAARRAQYLGGDLDPFATRSLPAFIPTTRGYTGDGQVVTGAGRRIDVRYEVVDLAMLRQATGDLQPRDRGRSNSDAWVAETAARLDPALLMPAPTADRGAPIVGPDDVIESGNGRVRAIARAYGEHPDRAAAYRAQLEGMGYTVPDGVEQPVLVARRTSELDAEARRSFVVEAQDSGVAELTPVERSRAVGRQLTPERLDLADPEAAIGAPANAAFVRAVTGDLPAGVRNRLFAGGKLTAEGRRELRQAIFARAWPDRDILERALELEEAGDAGALIAALERAAPAFAALRSDIEAGRVAPEFDISPEVLDAVRMIAAARDLAARSDTPADRILAELLDQVDLLDGAVSPLTQALVRKFWNGGRVKSDQVAAFLRSYAAEARKVGGTGDLLSGASVADVLRAVDREAFGDLPDDFARAPVKRFGREDEAPAPMPDLREGGFVDGAASPEAEAGDVLAAEELRLEDGPFGPVFAGYTDDPEGAIARLMEERTGEVPDAFVHPELGPVAFVYGAPDGPRGRGGFGLAHISEDHGDDVLPMLPRILREGTWTRLEASRGRAGQRMRIDFSGEGDWRAIALLDYKGDEKTWVLTAYDRKGQGTERSIVRPGDRSEAASASALSTSGTLEDSAPGLRDQDEAAAALQARLAEFREEDDDFLALPIGDSTVGDLLEDIDEDMRLAEVIASCGLKGAGDA